MRLITVCIIILVSNWSSGQTWKLKEANDLYDHIAYAEAQTIYESLLGSKLDSKEVRSKLAVCYLKTGNIDQAEELYADLANLEGASSMDVYNYAHVLRRKGKYTESNKWMDHFSASNPSDSRAIEYLEQKGDYGRLNEEDYFALTHLDINTSSAEFGGYPAGEAVYFISNRKTSAFTNREFLWDGSLFLDILKADKKGIQMVNPQYLPHSVNKKYHEGSLCFTKDGKTVFFTRNYVKKKYKSDAEIQNLELYRADVDDEGHWYNLTELPMNSINYSVGHPCLSPDERMLYFSSDMPGGFGGADIYRVDLHEDGSFGEPVNLGEKVNTEGHEMFPWLGSKGQLFFSSDGHFGLGGLDVFVMFPNDEGNFDQRFNPGKPLNSSEDDFALILLDNGISGYVSSNRSGGAGGDDIYAFDLIKPLKRTIAVKGLVTDVHSGELIPQAKVELRDDEGNVIASTMADDNGNYEFDLEFDQSYSIIVSKDDYFDNSGQLTTYDVDAEKSVIQKDLTLEKDPGLALLAIIKEAKTGELMEGVQVRITDMNTGEQFMLEKTGGSGSVQRGISTYMVGDKIAYSIELIKEGYFTKTVEFNHEIKAPGVIDVTGLLDQGLTMDKEIKDLAILINPINFDLGKWNIRPDAAEELDKIVEIMNEYPDMVVELGAHTDCRASASFNLRLSDKRAKSSAKYIQERITNPERISGKGYGESKLLNDCGCEGSVVSDCSEEEHARNRRTEFVVISTGDDKVKVNYSNQ